MKSNVHKSCNWDELFAGGAPSKTPRRRPRPLEHGLQSRCVRIFRLKYPNMAHNLFAVPNGGYRTKTTAALLKEEGQLAGVSDLIFLKRKGRCGALLLEAKWKGNYQSLVQREWQKRIEEDGFIYKVFHSEEEFLTIIENYLALPDE